MTERNLGLFFDTETNGLPLWKEPSEHPDQPHIVQLAAELVDFETREVLESMEVIVKPDGWVISAEMTEIHGISHEHALEVGIPEKDAIDQLLTMRAKANIRIAHNRTFDDRIIRIGLKRYHDKLEAEEPQPSDEWKDGEGFCTCYGSRALCALPKNKLPKLTEAYEILTGEKLIGAHSAMVDSAGGRRVYFALKDRGAL